MPSLRKKVSSYFRQLSFYNEPREKKHNINENSFITNYLEGHIQLKGGPPILYGKNPTDLPNYDVGIYAVGSDSIIGCYSGPNGGLTTIKRVEKHLSIPDTDIDFIDTQDELEVPVNHNNLSILQKSPNLHSSVDNTTMVIKVAGQEYLVTNPKKKENKSHSLGSLSDFEIEIEKTKICIDLSSNNNNNNSEDVKCKNQEVQNYQQNDTQKNKGNKSITTNSKNLQKEKDVKIDEGTCTKLKNSGTKSSTSVKANYGLSKSKSEDTPFQHKKIGKIIRISNRPTAHDTGTAVSNIPHIPLDPALPQNWNRKSDHVYGISDSLYDKNQVTKNRNGDPIADCFGVIARNDSAVLAVADGVNWGEKASIAAKSAVHGCLHYLDKTIFNDTEPFDDLTLKGDSKNSPQMFSQNRVNNTRDIFVCLLRAFNCAHDLILENEGMLTTLTVAVVLPLKSKTIKHNKSANEKLDSLSSGETVQGRRNERSLAIEENLESYICCVCNVGDTLAYVYSQKYGIRELTKGSHDIYCNRDMRDALGALGPVDGINPELSNLTLSITEVQKGDIILVGSDGLTDNFDPNVCRFTVNSIDSKLKKPTTDTKEKSHNKENFNTNITTHSPQALADDRGESKKVSDQNASTMPIKPPRKNKDSSNRSSRERSIESVQSGKSTSSSQSIQKNVETSNVSLSSKSSVAKSTDYTKHSDKSRRGSKQSSLDRVERSQLKCETSNVQLTCKNRNSLELTRKHSNSSGDYDNPLIAHFMHENSLDGKSDLEQSRKSSEQTSKPISSQKKNAIKSSSNQQKVHLPKTTTKNIPSSKTLDQKLDVKRPSTSTMNTKPNVTSFLRSKTSIEMRTSSRTILRNKDGIPFVTPLQRYEISLLLIEDVLKHGISGHDSPCTTAKKLCENLLNFTFSISSAKRHTLEDVDLYFDNVDGVLVEVSQQEKKIRRRKGLEHVQNLPGKLDHVSVVAYNVGNFSFKN